MSEIGLVIAVFMLALLVGRLRRARNLRSSEVGRWTARNGGVSLDDMGELISELAPSLRETAMVTAPQSYADRGHIWASPCGKRVYIN